MTSEAVGDPAARNGGTRRIIVMMGAPGAGKGTQAAHAEVRRHVDYLDVDRPLYPDHNAMKAAVESRTVLDAVESEIGELDSY